jgi:UDP-glucose 4-epimerase
MRQFKGAKVLVTGGCGFIGGHLVEVLQDAGAEVTVLDTNNCLVARNVDGVRLRVCDLGNELAVRRAVQGQQFVFHLAANADVPGSVRDPVATEKTNVLGTLHVALACADYKAKLVFSSSASIYGDRDDDVKEWEPKQPSSPYALQKLTCEHYLRIFGDLNGLDATSLRYFNVYGPRQNPASSYSGVITKFIQAAIKREDVTIYGDGKQTRDFVYVDDVVQANLLAAIEPKAKGKAFNVGTGKRTRILDMVQVLRELSGAPLQAIFKDGRFGDVRHSCADASYARETLNFTATTDLTSGLARTLHSMK